MTAIIPSRCSGCSGAGCGNPVRFVARRESASTADVFACGKHLAAKLTAKEPYVVVRVKT